MENVALQRVNFFQLSLTLTFWHISRLCIVPSIRAYRAHDSNVEGWQSSRLGILKVTQNALGGSCIAVTGGTIHMVCRNKDKAEEARADIVKETGNKVESDSQLQSVFCYKQQWSSSLLPQSRFLQEVYVHILDLSETKKVWEFAEGFKKKFKALNVLVSLYWEIANVWISLIFGGNRTYPILLLDVFSTAMRVDQ